jgi:hypothetical protein
MKEDMRALPDMVQVEGWHVIALGDVSVAERRSP